MAKTTSTKSKAATKAAKPVKAAHKTVAKKAHPIHFVAPIVLVSAVCVLLAVAVFVLTRSVERQNNELGMYQLLSHIDNQACRYLDHQPAVNGSSSLTMYSADDAPKLTYVCRTGQAIPPQEDGKSPAGDEFGAKVEYFGTRQQAYDYAEHVVNPTRYWSVDQKGQEDNIPQTALFTSVHTDKQQPYFDAYTVKANAVLRVTLPCDSKDDSDQAAMACEAKAEGMLQREMKGINVL